LYVFEDYEIQRSMPGVIPGEGTTASQNLDAAAVYFLEDVGREGYGGYLASDAEVNNLENEFLTSSANKILVGYPVDGIPIGSQGRMHATQPMNVTFTKTSYDGNSIVDDPGEFGHLYSTNDITSSGGNSGGPLCVQWDDGDELTPLTYYPAAIYLGGSNQTIVRSIDSHLVELFKRAEDAANDGDNSTGGGIATVNADQSNESIDIGYLKVSTNIAGGGWQIMEADPAVYFRESNTTVAVATTQNYTIVFEMIPGFGRPQNASVTLEAGTIVNVMGNYTQAFSTWRDTQLNGFSAEEITLIADPDSDRIQNLIEYAFNMIPTIADIMQVTPGSGTQGLPYYDTIGSGSTRQLTIEFVRRIALEDNGFAPVTLSYHPEFADDPGAALEDWDAGIEERVTNIDDVWERVIVKDPVIGGESRVGRVRVEESNL
jgi:hypothetical protein